MKRTFLAFLSFALALELLRGTQAPPAQQAQPPAQTAQPAPAVSTGSLNLNNASLTEVIDVLCRLLKINYILDPRVKGSVTLNTYGETRQVDARNLLDLILRINGATMAQVGEFYRIVPLAEASRLPLSPNTDPGAIPVDDQLMLNLVFLKYASVGEVSKLIEPFIGEGAKVFTYPPANLLLMLDSRRGTRRTMEIISLFDSDTLASQRVRLFEVKNGSPSAIAKEVEEVLASVSLTEKTSLVRFMPIDRINTIIAVAPNPGAFEEVEKWIKKLDTEIQITAGSVDVYVYRVKYSKAEFLAASIMQLYGGFSFMGFGGFGGFGGGYPGGYGGYPGGYGGVGGYPGGYGGYPGGYGGYPGGYGGYGGYPGGYGGYGGYPGGGVGYPGGAGFMPFPGGFVPQFGATQGVGGQPAGAAGGGGGAGAAGQQDLTGSYLGAGVQYGRIPRVIPNVIDNTLLIQATPQEHQQITKLLKEIDIPPRQVLIDARIYEVSLTGAFASGVSAFLQQRKEGSSRLATGSLIDGAVNLSAGMLVGQSRELLAFLSTQETMSRAKVISAPSVIATDSIAASINVGLEVPTLTAQSVSPIQSGGSSLFANTISTRSTGVNLNILARVNPSGVVTLMINQEVSAPQAPPAGSIQSPSFSRRAVNTQVTVQDGDTIAIGGIINETDGYSSTGIPLLHKIPILGAAFGSRSYSKERSELVIFMTPRVIYDTNQIVDASDELKGRLRRLTKMIQE